MAEKIIVEYAVDTSGFVKAESAISDVTDATKGLQNQIKATFAEKSIDEATKQLYEQGDIMGALITRYGDAGRALKAMQKELQTMAALGQNNTKEFKELTKATAELQDTIGDTRGEIKKLASDTRVFDLMVQGARGVTAAFSVATGVTAVFGKESEDLQKSIMKVQGAMAALQGVQELANIATEKGGIATKAYGGALQVVDRISKATGLSMAASWALATAGISVVIAGVVSLITYLNSANEASETFEMKRAESLEAERRRELEAKKEQLSLLSAADKEYFEKLEVLKRERLASGENERQVEFDMLTKQIEHFGNRIKAYKEGVYDYLGLTDEEEKVRIAAMTDYMNTAMIARNKMLLDSAKKGVAERVKEFKKERLEFDLGAEYEIVLKGKMQDGSYLADQIQTQINNAIDTTRVPTVPVDIEFRVPPEEAFVAFADNVVSTLQSIQPFMQASQTLIGSIIGLETATLEAEKEKQLKIVGDNAEKREQVEKQFAVKQAQLAQKQAIANKAFSVFQIAVDTAQSIAASAKQGFPQAIPFIALAAATGALQAAAVLAQPLPPIPQFEKGGKVIAGGRKEDGYLYGRSHREGGILIEAQGGEYIWDRETTKAHGDLIEAAHKNRLEDLILHKYVAPAMREQSEAKAAQMYDDYMLRATIKSGHKKEKENAEYIVRGVSSGVSEALKTANRYR